MENNIIENNITIGIEGLVGAGKTSICRELLKKVPNSITNRHKANDGYVKSRIKNRK